MNLLKGGHSVLKLLAGALGLDPALVSSLTIDCQPNSIVTVYVKGYVTKDQIEKVANVLRMVQVDECKVEQVGPDVSVVVTEATT
jgi:hypothetical protein